MCVGRIRPKESGAAGSLIDAGITAAPPKYGAQPAVTIAVAKKHGANNVWVAEDLLKRVLPSIPLGRIARPEEMVGAALYGGVFGTSRGLLAPLHVQGDPLGDVSYVYSWRGRPADFRS